MISLHIYTAPLCFFVLFVSHILSNNSIGLQWYLGCYNWSAPGLSVYLYPMPSGEQVDPVFCSHICLDEGYQLAALSRETCYCSDLPWDRTVNGQHDHSGKASGEGERARGQLRMACLHCGPTSPASPTNEARISPVPPCPYSCSRARCLPLGVDLARLAVYRTQGPYIYNISLSIAEERVQSGKSFLMQISGHLAAPLRQPTGLETIKGENFSSVDIVVSWTPGEQSLYITSVQDSGFFRLAPEWTFNEAGTYHIEVTAHNEVSMDTASLLVTALPPRLEALEVELLQEPKAIPSCVPFPVQETHVLKRVFLGETSTFRAFVAMGDCLDFQWHFSDDGLSLPAGPDCVPQSDCRSSTVRHTFGNEGIHTVSVNVSNIYSWALKIARIVVVRRFLSNLVLGNLSRYSLAVTQNVSLELQLLTTMHQDLSLNVTFEPGVTHSHPLDVGSSTVNVSSQLQLLHTYDPSSCQLYVHLQYGYRTSGLFPVSVSVLSPFAGQHATLPRPVEVYEPIRNLGPAPCWPFVIASRVSTTFRVTSQVDRTGSAVQWTVSRGNTTLLNQTTVDWFLIFSLLDAGRYILSIKAFNPVSTSSFQIPLLVQDAISELILLPLSPQYVETGATILAKASVSAGTNVTYLWKFGANSSLSKGSEIVTHVFHQVGVHTVTVTAENHVSQVHSEHVVFVVQDPVGNIALYAPRTTTVQQRTAISFTVMAGTNTTVTVCANNTLVYKSNRCVVGAEVVVALYPEQTGPARITVEASNLVSYKNTTVFVLVMPRLHTVTIEWTQTPVVGKSVILFAKVNGNISSCTNYRYTWLFPQGRTVHTASPIVSLSCDKPGPHLVNVTVTDHASSLSAGVLLYMTPHSAAPFLAHLEIAVVGTPVQFSIKNVPPGGRLHVDFGDGDKTILEISFEFSHRYEQAGIYHIRVTSDSREILSSLIDVQEPVKDLDLVGPDTFTLPTSPSNDSLITWIAKVSQGSSCLYRWRATGGKKNVSHFGSDQFTTVLSEPAQLRVEVSVTNEISGLTANISTHVMYPIMSVSLSVTQAVLGQLSHVTLKMAPQQDCDLSLDFGDGTKLQTSSRLHPPRTDCSQGRPCSSVFFFSHVYESVGVFGLSATVSGALAVVMETAGAAVGEPTGGVQLVLTSPAVIRLSDFINASASVQMGQVVLFQWQILLPDHSRYLHEDGNTSRSSLMYRTRIPGTHNVSVLISNRTNGSSMLRRLSVKVRASIGTVHSRPPLGTDHAALHRQPNGSYATQALPFSASTSAEEANFTFGFGDDSPPMWVQGRARRVQLGSVATGSHRFTREGTFFIAITASNEFYNATSVLPFHVEKMPANLQLITNSTVVYRNETALFNAHLAAGTNVTYVWNMGDQTAYVHKGPVVSHQFSAVGVYNVTVFARNRAGSMNASTSVAVLHRMRPVRIYTEKPAYSTEAEITFLAITEDTGPLEFLWHFGDRPTVRTTYRTVTKRYRFPERYNVTVTASNGQNSVTSGAYQIIIQRKIHPNRLLFSASVLLNTSVNFDCRISGGTNVSYDWTFGDGTYKVGNSSEQHVFHRTGEFTVEVKMSNLVSSASLTQQIFVVRQPCQPPPVKNMGPLNIQVLRHQTTKLGVTYESDIACDISQGLLYSWTLYQSGGLPLDLHPIETHRQGIELPGHFLNYGIYKAISKVQIVGSVVYSNYSVYIEVIRSPPVSVIEGGTNIFLSKHNGTILTLSGRRSHDLDYPLNTLSYQWDCKPATTIASPCFEEYVPLTGPVVTFPTNLLKSSFDQFKFTLTVWSGEQSSTSELFVTVTADLTRRVHVYCDHCQGSLVNWNEPFSVKAECENCGMSPWDISYTWKLYLVNPSSKAVVEVPFCSVVDISELSSLVKGGAASHLMLPEGPGLTTASHTRLPSVLLASPSTPLVSNTPDASYLATNLLESQIRPISMTSSDSIGDPTVSVPPSTAVQPHSSSFLLPFAEGNQMDVGHSQWQRAMEGSSDGPSHPESPSDFGFFPPSPGNYSIPVPPDYVPGFPVSEEGSVAYDDPFINTDFGFPPFFESSYHRQPGPPLPDADTDISETSSGDGKISVSQMPNFNHSYYESYFSNVKEGVWETSGDRHIGIGSSVASKDRDVILESNGQEGDNLMDSRRSPVAPEMTLLDLDRQQIDSVEFESYTFTGISSPVITFKPFMLKAKSLYMLEASSNSRHRLRGKTQFFFSTNDVPHGTTCQAQPGRGYEIHTEFSVFCTSGKADLLYKYSYSAGRSPKRTLYHGRNFQHYFNLPSGEPENDYKVTIYIEVWNQFGAAARPCPVSVEVLPSFQKNLSPFYHPDLELYSDGLRNLTKLTRMGNGMLVRNYVILLTDVLNRMSQDLSASRTLQTTIRGALISAICELNIQNQAEMIDSIHILKDLLSVASQVTVESARLVMRFVQSFWTQFREPAVPVTYHLEEVAVHSLVSLLSCVLKTSANFSEDGIYLTLDGIRTTRDLLLKYVLFSKVSLHTLSTRWMELRTQWHGRFQNTVISVRQTKLYLPNTLDADVNRRIALSSDQSSRCVISQLMFFNPNPYFWGTASIQINGDVVDLTLYNCTTRREVKVRSLSTPVTIEFQKPDQRQTADLEFSLQRTQMNIHQFNITAETLQEALQITVKLTRPANQTFPILLLLRMFEKPTPTLYKVKKIFRWEEDTVHIFLPPSSLNAPGSAYVALLNANYNQTPRNKYIASAVNYSLSMGSIQCLSWDGVRVWKRDGCTPLQGDPSRFNCSCSHLAPFAATYRKMLSRQEFTNVDQFVSLPDNLTLCSVMAVLLTAYVLAAVICKWADVHGEENQGPVQLEENIPSDKQLYAVTVDTGFRSRPVMTAKVYVVLHGENGISQTRELHSPGRLLFSRNSRHTFILSTPESLGPIWKVHLWHDCGGPSPSWYVSHVAVRDLLGGDDWFFPGECWLAVDEGDGRVERELSALIGGLGFRKLLHCKLTEYLEDFHCWVSVCSRPPHSPFTRTQRLGVCLLLALGYACTNAVLVSLHGDQHRAELGLLHTFAASLAMGVFSTLMVLPVGVLLSLLFRLSKETSSKDTSVVKHKCRPLSVYSVEAHSDDLLEDARTDDSYLSLHHHQQCAPVMQRNKYAHGVQDFQLPGLVPLPCGEKRSEFRFDQRNQSDHIKMLRDDAKWRSCEDRPKSSTAYVLGEPDSGGSSISVAPPCCRYLAWALCLSLCLVCMITTLVLGIKFSPENSFLWAHALSSSILLCACVLQPLLILISAAVVALRYRGRCFPHSCPQEAKAMAEILKGWQNGGFPSDSCLFGPCCYHQDGATHFSRVLRARRRDRHLRLARPPSPAERRRARERICKQTLLHKAFREAVLYVVTFSLVLFLTYGKPSSHHYQLNQAIRAAFTKSARNPFQEIRMHEDWWNWSMTALLDGLYWDSWSNNVSAKIQAGAVYGACILIGQPVLEKREAADQSACRGLVPEVRSKSFSQPLLARGDQRCGGANKEAGSQVTLGRTRSAVSSSLRSLRARGWLGQRTREVIVRFALFSPPTGLFTGVSLRAEQPVPGVLLPSASVYSAQVHRTAGAVDYAVMACELFFLLLTSLQLYVQAWAMVQAGLASYWKEACNWLEVTILIVSLVYYANLTYSSLLAAETADLLQRENYKAFVDLTLLSSCEQLTRSLQAVIVFLLLGKSISVLPAGGAVALFVATLRLSPGTLFSPLLAGAVLVVAFGCLGNLLSVSTWGSFTAVTGFFNTPLAHRMGISLPDDLPTLEPPHAASLLLYRSSFFCVMFIVWITLMTGVLRSFEKAAKKVSSRRKDAIPFPVLAAYIWDRVLVFAGRHKQRSRDNGAQQRNFHLEEFEDLLEELLLRLDAFTCDLPQVQLNNGQRLWENEKLPMRQAYYPHHLESEHGLSSKACLWETPSRSSVSIHNWLLSSKNVPDPYNHRSKLICETLEPSQRTSLTGDFVSAYGDYTCPQNTSHVIGDKVIPEPSCSFQPHKTIPPFIWESATVCHSDAHKEYQCSSSWESRQGPGWGEGAWSAAGRLDVLPESPPCELGHHQH
ncbi:polycystin-1-like protein 1 [Paramormyrops kingsleyae]|uniref:polycystin-1-like protein 1 n=1 Tax=Paramormyrops kingsleyae TaxID=1676925 RepID=UPI003B977E62